jgi:hypothetical protein
MFDAFAFSAVAVPEIAWLKAVTVAFDESLCVPDPQPWINKVRIPNSNRTIMNGV